MIYDGKEYVEVVKDDASVGDLVHIMLLEGVPCNDHDYIKDIDNDGDFWVGSRLSDGSFFITADDSFKTYKYVKNIDMIGRGDKVKVVGVTDYGDRRFIGSFGEVLSSYNAVNNDYRVVVDGTYYYFPPASLELIEKPTQPITEELSEKVGSNAITLDEAANNLVTSKAWTQSSEVKGKSPGTLAGKAMQSFSKGIVRAWVKPSEANVKEGDYMVITDNNNGHEFEIGETVEVLNPYDGDDDFHAVGVAGNWYVKYADARFATADEIATLNKPQLTFDRGDHVKILSDIAEGHADFSIDSVVTAQFRTDDGVMVQNLKGDVRKVIADEFLRKATPDEAIAAISARYGHGKRTLKTQIDDFYDGMSSLLVAKNENYGDSFSKQYDKYGMQGVEMRLNDKFMRLEQLIAGQPDKVGESVEDTLKDIIGYSTLALLKINENRTELTA